MQRPYWYKLIWYWVNCKKRSGLTLPYILGCIEQESKFRNTTESINDLLDEMAEYDSPNMITCKMCYDIGQLVFGMVDRRVKYSLGEQISPGLYLTDSGTEYAKTLNELKAYCTKEYADRIQSQTYSWNRPVWSNFVSEDYKLISEAQLVDSVV